MECVDKLSAKINEYTFLSLVPFPSSGAAHEDLEKLERDTVVAKVLFYIKI